MRPDIRDARWWFAAIVAFLVGLLLLVWLLTPV
jgi:hypothetical protein